jgi:hypothetical protein
MPCAGSFEQPVSGIEPTSAELRATYSTAQQGGTMHVRTCLRAGVAAAVGIAATVVAPVASAAQPQPQLSASQDVGLTAASVPLGGLVTSFLGNQVIYCSIICPLLVETAVAPAVGTVQAPGTFLSALTAGDMLKAIGAAAASVTGPTNIAAENAIVADGSIPAKRALNALEVGVVGLLNILPAAGGGLPGVVSAIETARRDTFIALNLPVVANPAPTVMPHGVLQVATVGALNVGGAVIFPAFNHVLSAAFETPDAAAQELAASGNPIGAAVAGLNIAAVEGTAAINDIADSVATAISSIRTASEQSHAVKQTVQPQNSAKATALTRANGGSPDPVVTTKKSDTAAAGTSHALRAAASNLRQSVRNAIERSVRSDLKRSDSKKAADSPHHAAKG